MCATKPISKIPPFVFQLAKPATTTHQSLPSSHTALYTLISRQPKTHNMAYPNPPPPAHVHNTYCANDNGSPHLHPLQASSSSDDVPPPVYEPSPLFANIPPTDVKQAPSTTSYAAAAQIEAQRPVRPVIRAPRAAVQHVAAPLPVRQPGSRAKACAGVCIMALLTAIVIAFVIESFATGGEREDE